MAKCSNCGRKGLFLKLQNGLCPDCIMQEQQSVLVSQIEKSMISFVAPERMNDDQYWAMRQDAVDYLEDKYDFSSVEGIQSLPKPSKEFKAEELKRDFTGRVEYYLLSKAESYKKANEPDLAIACLQKANELMPMYGDFYSRDYYMRLPRYLRKLRRFDEARTEEQKIENLFHGSYKYLNEPYWPELRMESLTSQCKALKTDLVAAVYVRCCCGECAKYRGRIYNFKGGDCRFPPFPDYFSQHHSCGITLTPFIYGVNSLSVEDGKCLRGEDLVEYSNRPFVDDRTTSELADLEIIEQRRKKDAEKEVARSEYDWLWEYIPESCPKSFSAYMRMKNARTEKFQAIVAVAKARGRFIDI